MKPKIITFEGIDGAGKSTLVKSLRDHFTAKGLSVLHTWEPWSASEIDPDPFIATMQLMIDRRRHCAMIRELSDRYDLILIDRFDLSTEAYQGYGDSVDIHIIQQLNLIATTGVNVTRRIGLHVSLVSAVDRIRHRGDEFSNAEFERLRRIHTGYSHMYDLHRLFCINANHSKSRVLTDAIGLIEEVL